MTFRLISILLFLSCFVNAQQVKGKVYDNKTVINGAYVYNQTQNISTITNEKGDYTVNAKLNDTIIFASLFHKQQTIVVSKFHLDNIIIIELKKELNELDEVEILSNPDELVFEEKTYNQDLQNIIKEDIKKNPHKYTSANAQYGVDFIQVIGLIAKLFKKKKKEIDPYETLISYEDLKLITKKHSYFNNTFIVNSLNIPEEHIKIFLDFCSAKGLKKRLFKEEQTMYLIDKMVIYSKEFLEIYNNYSSIKK